MRILQVSSPLQLGGGEIHVIELTEALRHLGHDVVVIGRRGAAVKPQIEFSFLNSFDIGTAIRLHSLLKREHFDIVHAHVARDYPLVIAASYGLPIKVVLTRHLLYPIKSKFLYRRVDGWIAPTKQILETLAPMKPRKAAVIPNWVDLEKFAYKPRAPHSPITLGILGQISPHKGHDDAIEAVRLLGPGYRLHIAGKGQDDYIAELRKKAANLPVNFAGFVALPDFFADIDVLLVPSWEEPFGIVILEGMASGIPVIATAAGGPLDILRPGVDGVLVPPKDPRALADAIRSLDGQREGLIRSARQRAEAEFDIRKVVPKIEAFYRKV
jgi:glycosyltransferase involved in cell wall biosynthesis